MRTHRNPGGARALRSATAAMLVAAMLVAAMLGGCLRSPAADAAMAQAVTEMADQLGAMQQDNAEIQNQIDSLRAVVAQQDTVLRRLANMAGVPISR